MYVGMTNVATLVGILLRRSQGEQSWHVNGLLGGYVRCFNSWHSMGRRTQFAPNDALRPFVDMGYVTVGKYNGRVDTTEKFDSLASQVLAPQEDANETDVAPLQLLGDAINTIVDPNSKPPRSEYWVHRSWQQNANGTWSIKVERIEEEDCECCGRYACNEFPYCD